MSKFLSEFDEVVMRAILLMKNRAYGVELRRVILDKTGKDVSFGSLYSALERMEKKGYIAGETGEPTEERGGRAKRYYSVQGKGIYALSDAERARLALSNPVFVGVPNVASGGS